MNIAYFLLPKSRVAYLYDDYTFRQGLEKMRHHGYTAIPVITRDGRYAGTVSEGDFLWQLLNEVPEERKVCSMKDLEQLHQDGVLPDGSAWGIGRVGTAHQPGLSAGAYAAYVKSQNGGVTPTLSGEEADSFLI